jgi:hypothetical protein
VTENRRGRTVLGAPGDEVAEDLTLRPSVLEDTYTRPAELVPLRDALVLASPDRTFDQAGDFDLKRLRDRHVETREKQAASDAAWRRERENSAWPGIREAQRRIEARKRIWWRLPCGTIVGVERPRERNWPSAGDPDPTQFREEQRLRDLADQIVAGPVFRADLSQISLGRLDLGGLVAEIRAEVGVLRQQAAAIKLKRGSPYV